MWKFRVIEDWDSVWCEEHCHKWNELMGRSQESHVFFHPTVVQIWLDTYLPLHNLTPLFVWGESSEGNISYLPLVMRKKDWRGAYIHSINPVGYSDYDYHDPIFLISPTSNELAAYWEELLALLRTYRPDEILLSGFSDKSITSYGEWKKGEICPSLNLEKVNSEDALMSFFSTKLRGDIRRQIRRMEEIGTLRFVEYPSVQDIPSGLFEQFLEAHHKKWPNAYKMPHFHERLVAACSLEGPIHFSTMLLGDIPISWHLGFEFRGTYYYYMPAGNPEYLKFSPVKIHLYYLILRAIKKNYSLYDHLRGDETYKSGWSDSFQHVYDRAIYSDKISSKVKHSLVKLRRFVFRR